MTQIGDLLETFRDEFPEFVDAADAGIRLQLGVALEIYSVRPRGVVYLAAHLLVTHDAATGDGATPAQIDGGAKVVIGQRIGAKSVTYGRASTNSSQGSSGGGLAEQDQFEQTVYGRAYTLIRDASLAVTIRQF